MENYFTYKDVVTAAEEYWNTYVDELIEVKKPKAYFFAGQSGAGKSTLKNLILESNKLIIDVDEFRKFHPKYLQLYQEYRENNAQYTHEFASEVAKELLEKAIQNKVNIVIDGTLKSLETPKARAELLKKNNYSIEILGMVVKPEKSFLSNLVRYEEQLQNKKVARLAPKSVHDECIKKIPNTLSELYKSNLFDNIRLYDREENCIYNMKENSNIDPKEIMIEEFTRKWTKVEYIDYLKQWDRLIDSMKSRNATDIENKVVLAEKKERVENILLEEERVTILKEKNIENNMEYGSPIPKRKKVSDRGIER